VGIRPDIPDGRIMSLKGGDQYQQASGSGGSVSMNGTLNVATAGNNAIGMVAQSVGGAGGIVANAQSQVENGGIESRIYSSQPNDSADGGEVEVSLGHGTIATRGTGAHGVLAQSIGGGGGIIGLPGTQARLSVMSPASPDDTSGHGRGGNVTVRNPGTINVQGRGAVGILAQSISGGGGLLLDADGHTVHAGGASRKGSSSAKVDVEVSGSVTASGPDGIGVFAQNVGGTGVNVQVDGAIMGGTENGMAVWVDSTAPSTLTTGTGGSLQAGSGKAIHASSAPLAVVNQGTISGSVDLANGNMDNRGTLNAGAEFKGDLHNSGVLALGSPLAVPAGASGKTSSTAITGNFTQSAAGTLRISPDFTATLDTAMLHVSGDAVLDGMLEVQPVAVLPGRELHVLSVAGAQTGTLHTQNSPVIQYTARHTDQNTYVQAGNASFDNAVLQLSGNALSVAQHLQRSWESGGASPLARLYASLDQAARDGISAYHSRVTELTPAVAVAPAAQTQIAMGRFTDAMMSCPAYLGDTATLSERDCVWGQITGRRSDQDGNDGWAGYSYDSVTYQIVGRRRMAPDWLLGGSVAYQTTKLRNDNGKTRGSGDTGYLGLVLKREAGPWTFSAALGGGYGSHEVSRHLTVPGAEGTASSRPDVYSASARLRAARTFDQGSFYLKP